MVIRGEEPKGNEPVYTGRPPSRNPGSIVPHFRTGK